MTSVLLSPLSGPRSSDDKQNLSSSLGDGVCVPLLWSVALSSSRLSIEVVGVRLLANRAVVEQSEAVTL